MTEPTTNSTKPERTLGHAVGSRGTDEERLAEDHGERSPKSPEPPSVHGDHLEFLKSGGQEHQRGGGAPRP